MLRDYIALAISSVQGINTFVATQKLSGSVCGKFDRSWQNDTE